MVHYGFPGRWQWEVAYRRPDSFRLTVQTTADSQSLVSDGRALRTYLGSALVAEEPVAATCASSLASWLSVTGLDGLEGPGVRWHELPPAELGGGAARGLEAVCSEERARYRLLFDRSLRLVAASGPISIPTLGIGRFEARFSDFRKEGGLEIPFQIDYDFDGQPFIEETVVVFEKDAPTLQ